ncbi:GT2 family glycosyltransferase [Bacillus oleivorans]|uniref:GT2 family glycosyltransferase n=1 Tax=Bacillus oleivorans TaxID=1448271 RepID=A0A285D4W0_9BACI|nr:glycosyltransferase [Bacillus oleivorans]SNX74842.1 GT2 family glycosyltransferase [Bacillus oleivorans]
MNLEGIHFSGHEEIKIQHIFANVQNTFTYEFWVNPNASISFPFQSTSLVSGHKGQNWAIGAGYGGIDGKNAGVGVSVGRNGIAVFEHGYHYFPATLVYRTTLRDWTHVAIVVKNKIPRLYLNGRFVKQGLMSQKENVFPSGVIGALESYGGFIGKLDQIRIWNYDRSDHEIRTDMKKELGYKPGLLVNINAKNGERAKKGEWLGAYSGQVTFPESHNPLVSIIIPVYNKWDYTYACLKSINANTNGVDYEVIIADDMSSDQTTEINKFFQNIRVIRDGINKGFIKNCNTAASYAKGKYLLFLNNDTEVQKDWLKNLVELMESDQKIGIVGAQLIYPNGNLQEAGSIIFNDGSCLGYGRGANPELPEYSYVREVYYCSGACLLINKELFNKAGMFDEQFQPAYYEEVDLSMKIRELGYKVMYQPKAKVIHHEFGSSTSQKAIELQVQNKAKFYYKWKQQIQVFPPPVYQRAEYFREINRQKLKILVVDDRIPALELGSGYPRTFSILQSLSELGYQVTFFPLQSPEKTEPHTTNLQQKGIEVFYNLIQEKLNFGDFYSKRKDFYDAIWISRPHNMKEIGQMIHSINHQQKIIYDAEALYSHREILRLGLHGTNLSQQKKEAMIKNEINLINKSDIVITVSKPEKELIRLYSNKPVLIASHSVDINVTPAPFIERKDILFVGGFLTSPSPNEDAMQYFVKEIFPIIYKTLGAKLWIVGTNYLKSIQQLASEHVIVTGRVDNLWEYYNKCKVFVIPTRYAAGIPLKAYEAFSHGLPTVVSPLIANQLEINEDVALIGGNPHSFAQKVIQCYQDLNTWYQLRANGMHYIRAKGDKEQLKKELIKLNELVKKD